MSAAELAEQSIEIGGTSLRILAPARPREALMAGDPSFPPFWVRVWPSAVELAVILLERPLAGLKVIELGAGLAVTGLAAARAGATVTLTDGQSEPLEIAARSAQLNGLEVETRLLDWNDPEESGAFDLALAAEVLNEPAAAAPLARAIAMVLAPEGRALVADPWFPSHDLFLAALGREGLSVHTEERSFAWHQSERITRIFEISRG